MDGCSPPHASRIVAHAPSRFVRTTEFQNRRRAWRRPPSLDRGPAMTTEGVDDVQVFAP